MAVQKINTTPVLVELRRIVAQLEAAKDVNNETRSLSVAFAKAAQLMDSWAPLIGADFMSREEMDEAAARYDRISKAFSPLADVDWTKDSLASLVEQAKAMQTLLVFTPPESEEVGKLLERLPILTRTGGSAPRNTQPDIAGRPRIVRVTMVDGTKVSEQAGNKQTSLGNIKMQLVNYLRKNGVEPTEAEVKEITEGLRQVITGKQADASLAGIATASAVE